MTHADTADALAAILHSCLRGRQSYADAGVTEGDLCVFEVAKLSHLTQHAVQLEMTRALTRVDSDTAAEFTRITDLPPLPDVPTQSILDSLAFDLLVTAMQYLVATCGDRTETMVQRAADDDGPTERPDQPPPV